MTHPSIKIQSCRRLGSSQREAPRQAAVPGRCAAAALGVDAPIYTRGRARRSLIDTVTFRVLSQITTALALVIQVRGMSEHDFGVYSLLYTFIPVIGTLL